MHSSEAAFLLLALRQEPDSAEIARRLAEPIDWTELVALSLDHGVAALLFKVLLDGHRALLPDEIAAAAEQFLQESGRRARQGLEDLVVLLDRLDAVGIPAVPLKGPALALSLYGDLAVRPFRDIDFLVRERDMMPALEEVAALGYRPRERLRPVEAAAQRRYAGEVILFRGPEDLPVEPHWAFAPRTMAVAVDYDVLWERVAPAPLGERTALALDPIDLLLSLAIHGAKEQWAKLKWIVDIDRFLCRYAELDWEIALMRAEQQGCRRILLLALASAATVLHSPLPPIIYAAITGDPETIRLTVELNGRLFQPGYEAPSIFRLNRFAWRLRENRRDQLRYAVRTAATPRVPHFGIMKLPAPLFFGYVPVKLVHDYLLLPPWLALKEARARRRQPGRIGP